MGRLYLAIIELWLWWCRHWQPCFNDCCHRCSGAQASLRLLRLAAVVALHYFIALTLLLLLLSAEQTPESAASSIVPQGAYPGYLAHGLQGIKEGAIN